MKILNTLIILLAFSSQTFCQIPIMPAKDLLKKRLFQDIQINKQNETKESIREENKNKDRDESAKLKKSKEAEKIARILNIEFKKSLFIPQQFNNSTYLLVKIFYSKLHKVDSVYYETTEYAFDPVAKTIKSIQINDKLTDESHLFLQNLISKSIRRIDANLSQTSAFEISSSLLLNGKDDVKNQETLRNEFQQKVISMSDTVSKLNFQNFGLRSFPSELYKFKNAKQIDLSNNKLTELKINTKKFKNLQSIILANNVLTESAIHISRNKNVKIINLINNDLEKLPKRISRSKNLQELLCSNNLIKELDKKNLKNLKKLRILNLYNCRLGTIPPQIKYLKNLEVLDIYHNDLKFLPKEISSLSELTTLAVANNELWNLPEEMYKMDNLVSLYVHHNLLNRIEKLPKNLVLLDLGFNIFTEVPSQLKYLEKLEELDISNNKMQLNAKDLLDIKALKSVYLFNNDFDEDPTKFAELQQIIVDLKKKSVKVK